MSVGEVAVLGVGMHPWGKWGRNFVEYGVVAAREALADAGVWPRIALIAMPATVTESFMEPRSERTICNVPCSIQAMRRKSCNGAAAMRKSIRP